MEWPQRRDLFLGHYQEYFHCGADPKDKNPCVAVEIRRDVNDLKFGQLKLIDQSDWDEWLDGLNTPSVDGKSESRSLHDSIHILFIPQMADVVNQMTSMPGSILGLPFSHENWEAILGPFGTLPGHLFKAIARDEVVAWSHWAKHDEDDIAPSLWMHVSTTHVLDYGAGKFAVAATHDTATNHTLAIVLGSSTALRHKMMALLLDSGHAIHHPCLLLGTCAELHLEHLNLLVRIKQDDCVDLTDRLERDLDAATRNGSTDEGITKGLISDIGLRLGETLDVEHEVKATRRRLENVLPPEWRSGQCTTNPEGTSSGEARQDVDHQFQQRFADIFADLDDLTETCRIAIEDLSFMTNVIRSELSRQEARHVGQESKISTVIAFVAMLYLPMTTTATIFAMPIFQWSNDWRDWRYQPVNKGNMSSSSDNNNNGSTEGLPVFSGYFWIYLSISLGFTLMTIEGWWRFTSRDIDRRKGHHWLVYLLRKLPFWPAGKRRTKPTGPRYIPTSFRPLPTSPASSSQSRLATPRSGSATHRIPAGSTNSLVSSIASSPVPGRARAGIRRASRSLKSNSAESDAARVGDDSSGSSPVQGSRETSTGSGQSPEDGNNVQLPEKQIQERRSASKMV
ncbi:hypothetical protein F4778DRAFT_239029 [Xylariomycetidae sp. FL2044]|nr:hypothetical protein F4778DRAFT_239029 [Xylariomycetidae sp. FL2044]